MAHLQFMSSSCSLSLSFYLSIYPALSLAPSSSRSTDTVQQHILVACSSHRLHRHKNHDDKLKKKQVHSDQDVQLGQCTGLSNINQ